MAYSKYLITGDLHGDFSRFKYGFEEKNIAVFVLGDAGINWTLDYHDEVFKASLAKKFPNITFYFLRGNHDARPEKVVGMTRIFDEDLWNDVYMEYKFPNFRYLIDGETYRIENFKVLAIGGAYSVDKWWRLQNNQQWFEDEQLSREEMNRIGTMIKGQTYDFVFTHTCPVSWEPRDLFLSTINQSTVDKTMENWFEEIKDTFNWGMWLFAHYHTDRPQGKNVEIFYNGIEEIEEIWKRKE